MLIYHLHVSQLKVTLEITVIKNRHKVAARVQALLFIYSHRLGVEIVTSSTAPQAKDVIHIPYTN